jgi:D-threo-aldose 1-dehydrogenase
LYRETTDAESHGAIVEAWDRGIRYFDTAPHYGLGLSEKRLGQSLAAYPRHEYSVSTKVGRLLVPNPSPTGRDSDFVVPDDTIRQWDFSRDGVLRSIEGSLERLGMSRIDIAYVHDPDAFSDDSAKLALETLTELRDQGVVGAIGVGTNQTYQLGELFAEGLIDVAMLAGRYTLLEQGGLDSVLEPAAAVGGSVVIAGVYNSGLLANNRPPVDAKYNYVDAPPELIAKATAIAEVCESFGVTLPQAAIAFVLRHRAVAGVVFGMRTALQVADNIERFSVSIPPELWTTLASRGLVDNFPPK